MDIKTIYELFPTDKDCLAHLEKIRWGDNPRCPYCNSDKITSVPKESRFHCNKCYTSFSVTVGTIFHHTHTPIQKWFLAISILLNDKKEISVRKLAEEIQVNRNTSWQMIKKINKAMIDHEQRDLLIKVYESLKPFKNKEE